MPDGQPREPHQHRQRCTRFRFHTGCSQGREGRPGHRRRAGEQWSHGTQGADADRRAGGASCGGCFVRGRGRAAPGARHRALAAIKLVPVAGALALSRNRSPQRASGDALFAYAIQEARPARNGCRESAKSVLSQPSPAPTKPGGGPAPNPSNDPANARRPGIPGCARRCGPRCRGCAGSACARPLGGPWPGRSTRACADPGTKR